MNEIVSNYVNKVTRALAEKKESDIALLHKKQPNITTNGKINGVEHRWAGSGEDSSGTPDNSMALEDFAKAGYALTKANVSKAGRVAIIDPSVTYTLNTSDWVYRQDYYGPNNALKDSLTGMKYVGSYMGFDVFESNFLDETADAATNGTGTYIANMFMGQEALIGAMRTMPDIETARNWRNKSDVYHATIRYGMDVFRPESLVVVCTKNTV